LGFHFHLFNGSMLRKDLTPLVQLCQIHATSGDEINMKQFILEYVEQHAPSWNVMPEVVAGQDLQDNLILRFGKPRIAAFAHMDSVGFTVRYGNQLVPIGSPAVVEGDIVCGTDSLGPIECSIHLDHEHHVYHSFPRGIERGTPLAWKPSFKIEQTHVRATFLDNRVGVYNLLKLAETVEHGLLIFSTWEEHGGGAVPCLTKYLYEEYNIKKCLISDVTWASDGVVPDGGVVISARDAHIPRRSFVQDIVRRAGASGISYQIEVEAGGSSDGREVQLSPYPVDWCFIGPCIEEMHSSGERMAIADLAAMISLYQMLFRSL
jgi:putative aminopeptidase FrvX